MKRYLMILLSFLPLLSMAQDDDMYFTSSKKKQQVTTTTSARSSYYGNTLPAEEWADTSTVDYRSSKRSEDEYNRRYSYRSDAQEQSRSAASGYDEEELTNAGNTELDYRYSRRILRFHSPNVVVSVSSPYYWDLVYDCGVYDYLYDYFCYDPFYYNYWSWYRPAWSFSWGWGGWSYGWSYYGWNSWYGPMWGWNYPYYRWNTWGYGYNRHYGG